MLFRSSTKLDFGPVHVDFGITKQEFHIGPGSVGVPGIIKGLLHTQEQLGAVPIKTVLEPAIIAAKDGIVLSNKQANLLSLLEPIMGYEETSREIFFRDGELIKGGTQLIMSEFADFLDVLWREGSDLFYRGEVAKLLLCSPVTLYAILSLIRSAVSNFHMEQKAGEMQELVVAFRAQWEKFTEKLDRLGKTIGTVSTHYDELSGARRNQLEKPMEKIQELQMGQGEDVQQIEGDDE